MVRFVLAGFAALILLTGNALAAADPARHALSVPVLERLKAAVKEGERVLPKTDDKDDADQPTVEEFAKSLDATPGVKALLSRHGFTSQSFALATLAYFHAGFYLMMEPSMDKKKAAELRASYPKETQGNIELLRKNPKLMQQ